MEQTAEYPSQSQHEPMLQLERTGDALSAAVPFPVPPSALAPVHVAPKMSGLRKAAILLITLGEEASGSVVKDLSDDEVHIISKTISTTDPVTSAEAFEVLREFNELATARSYVVKGGMEYASKMLRRAFGIEGARRLLDRVNQSISTEAANFDSLQKSEPQQLANFIHGEHPQTVALILSHLNPSQAASLLSAMPDEMRPGLAKRMANLEQISPEIISKIANVIGDKLKSLGDISRQSYGGVRAVAEMFNHMDTGLRKTILNEIAKSDAELVATIRHLMFVFEDLLTIDAAGIRELLAVVDRHVLTVALKGTSEKLQNHVMQHLSMVGSDMLREDIEALGPVKIKDVESAQQEVISALRDLESAGVLSLTSGPSDRYVV
jgi:flagellar motor switch protein FliG